MHIARIGETFISWVRFGGVAWQRHCDSKQQQLGLSKEDLAPELFIDKVKGMTNLIEQSTLVLIDPWKGLIDAEGGKTDIKIDDYLKKFSGEVISRACFGSSYAEGGTSFSQTCCASTNYSHERILSGHSWHETCAHKAQ
ncbi:hypothetical protein SASPL_133640 [Salvia splendens]|uniref:Uncharacterized protein n=1 Tax=Salvia splendens TaxID=180675 RepID=A0A8X8X4N5_SALSN|nr:cytochrome P450 714C3-like [Salvia splendens]KAG6406044.1 hypothetical protein SASPL_133640 [Salvia splendens]